MYGHLKKDVAAELNELDKHGNALIHYFAHLNYFEAIKLIAENGANVNILSTTQQYPLLIAAAKGHDSTVSTVIRCGGNLSVFPVKNENSLKVPKRSQNRKLSLVSKSSRMDISEEDD
jgi:ankyrin repeat protein